MTISDAKPCNRIGLRTDDRLRYSCTWEDAEVLCEALAPVSKGGRLLSISAAGDNTIALLLLDPSEIIAVDLNLAQLACTELKIAAFQKLDRIPLLSFLGVLEAESRWSTYSELLRAALSPWAKCYWDGQQSAIEKGIIHAGRFERYLQYFRRFALPVIHSYSTVQGLRKQRDHACRESFYKEIWDNRRWRLLCRIFFSRLVMSHFGRDPSFFKWEPGNIGAQLLARARRALTTLPVHSNPYITYILCGNYDYNFLPLYLRESTYHLIKNRLDRIRLHHGRAEAVNCGPFNGFNLSDIFEYMGTQEYEKAFRSLLQVANPGSRFVYWNLLVDRQCPETLIERVQPLRNVADQLHEHDLGCSYQRLNIDEIRG